MKYFLVAAGAVGVTALVTLLVVLGQKNAAAAQVSTSASPTGSVDFAGPVTIRRAVLSLNSSKNLRQA
jgi:hypothetical protein